MMTYSAARNLLIEDALKDIETGEGLVGQALTQDTAALCAAIAQAKLLAVIASALNELAALRQTQDTAAENNREI